MTIRWGRPWQARSQPTSNCTSCDLCVRGGYFFVCAADPFTPPPMKLETASIGRIG